METPLDLRRWQEKPAGVAYRRWVIVSTGLRQLMRMRFFKILLFLAWTAGVFMAAAGFVFTQTLASGGWLENMALEMGPRPHAIVSAFCSMVLLYPDICIHGLFSLMFWWHSFIGLWLSLIGLSIVIPRLIARDRASNALTIYLSRPLTSLDYLLGKLGIIVGILLLLWTGPLLLGWILSMAFAPNSDFFVYSLTPLLRALLFNSIALVTLATIALAVSALGKTAFSVLPIWIGVWIGVWVLSYNSAIPESIRSLSFERDLHTVCHEVFKLDEILVKASNTLPLSDRGFNNTLKRWGTPNPRDSKSSTAATGLTVLVVASSFVFARRLRPE